MITSDQQRRLRLFNEKADKLLRLPLLRADTVSLKIEWDAESNEVRHVLGGVTEADVDAFVLTARLFVQDRDGISFRSLVEIYDDPDVSEPVADRFRDARAKWLAYLDVQPGMAVNLKTLTIGDIFDVLFYGDLAHVDENKRAEYDVWRSFPAFAALATWHLIGFLAEVASFVAYFRGLNGELLDTAKVVS